MGASRIHALLHINAADSNKNRAGEWAIHVNMLQVNENILLDTVTATSESMRCPLLHVNRRLVGTRGSITIEYEYKA